VRASRNGIEDVHAKEPVLIEQSPVRPNSKAQSSDQRGKKGPTRTNSVRSLLADEIVEGVLLPGMTLDETEIAERYGVSRTPVREAIRNLAATGLVEMRPHRSAIVTRPSLVQIRSMFEIMAELEALCASMAAIHMTDSEKHGLQQIHKTLDTIMRDGDPSRYHAANEQFHAAIYSGSHNDYLVEITLATRVRLSPFRRVQFTNAGRLSQSYNEHDAIIAAVIVGDRDAAANAMRAHIMTVEVAYEKFAASI
jgi:DNA-binding GntR family transcriptional regulator